MQSQYSYDKSVFYFFVLYAVYIHCIFTINSLQMCTFGGRLHTIGGRRSYVFGRKTDILRAAFLNVLEKQLNPPPPK